MTSQTVSLGASGRAEAATAPDLHGQPPGPRDQRQERITVEPFVAIVPGRLGPGDLLRGLVPALAGRESASHRLPSNALTVRPVVVRAGTPRRVYDRGRMRRGKFSSQADARAAVRA